MVELKPCPKCNQKPELLVKGNCNIFYCECGVFGLHSCENTPQEELLEWRDGRIKEWNEHVDQQSKPSLPKTMEEAIDGSNKNCTNYFYLDEYANIINPNDECIDDDSPDINRFKFLKSARRVKLFMQLTFLAEIYNDGWVWDGKAEFFIIFNYGTDDHLTIGKTEHPYTPHIKFKSRKIAEEFAKNFGDMIKEFYSL